METITLAASSSAASNVFIGAGFAKNKLKELSSGRQTFLLVDGNVYSLYKDFIEKLIFPVFVIKPGENSKNFNVLQQILKFLYQNGALKNSLLIVIGGGVSGDIGALSASLFMRGIEVVQVPTTLLSQVDSSVGGKTAVNFMQAKNIIGSFYQPSNVVCDTDFLNTLKRRDIKSGLGEIIKTAGLNKKLYSNIAVNAKRLNDLEYIKTLVAPCIRHKADVVALDEKETGGLRKTLNLGHTTGHALELFYGRNSHGQYVAEGLLFELFMAKKLGVSTGLEDYQSLIEQIAKPRKYNNLGEALKRALADKKNRQPGKVSLILLKDIGDAAEVYIEFDEYLKLAEEYNMGLKI